MRPALDPEDDGPWIGQASQTTPWSLLEEVEGASPETVVDSLGPPLRVHRGSTLFERCQQIYVYAALLDGERVPVGLCITAEGEVRGSVGRMSFGSKYRDMCGDLTGADVAGLYMFASILAAPFALLLAAYHRRRPKDRTVHSRLTGAMEQGVQRGHGPVEALELKMSKDDPIFINVRFAGHACCSADLSEKPR